MKYTFNAPLLKWEYTGDNGAVILAGFVAVALLWIAALLAAAWVITWAVNTMIAAGQAQIGPVAAVIVTLVLIKIAD